MQKCRCKRHNLTRNNKHAMRKLFNNSHSPLANLLYIQRFVGQPWSGGLCERGEMKVQTAPCVAHTRVFWEGSLASSHQELPRLFQRLLLGGSAAAYKGLPRNVRRIFVISAILMALGISAMASNVATAADKLFEHAQWIAPSDGPQRDTGVYHFRRRVELSSVPRSLGVRVSADSRFILYANGVRVGEGPAKSDLAHWKYEHFDLAPFLHQGTNVISAVVWNFGINAAVSQISSRTAFLLEADDADERILDTNASWQVALASDHQIIAENYGKLLNGYYAAVPGEIIDERLCDWTWNTSISEESSEDSHFQAASVIGAAALRYAKDGATIWMLQPDLLPPMEYSRTSFGKIVANHGAIVSDGESLALSIGPNSRATVLVDRGALTTAYPELITSGGKDARVRVTYAEALLDNAGNKGNRNDVEGRHIVGLSDEFIADGGSGRSFSPLEWRTWRFIQLDITTGTEALQIDRATAWFSAFPFQEKGGFAADDPDLKTIWDVGWRTARLDAHDTYMDTPYWERLQYVGDLRIQALISYSVAGDDRLARQAIDAIDSSRLPEGITQSRYPSAMPQIIPPFSLVWIGMLHDFWMYRDDPDYVRGHLSGSRAVLQWFLDLQRADGLLGVLPWWNFVDWTEGFPSGVPPQDADGGSALITLQFIEALQYSAALERSLGDATRARAYDAAKQKAVTGLREHCWNSATELFADTPAQTHYSQHTNALAVWLNVVPQGRQRSVMEKVLVASTRERNRTGSSPELSLASYYFRFYLARAMESAGMGDRYLSMLEPWRAMLRLGLTTWAETPEPTRSDSHAWSAHPNFDLLRIVAGIRPGAPGFARAIIEPRMGQLKNIDAVYPHERGDIQVSLRRAGRGVYATITIPPNVPSEFVWAGKIYSLHTGQQVIEVH
jgi:alpha-L-rhamnosidase